MKYIFYITLNLLFLIVSTLHAEIKINQIIHYTFQQPIGVVPFKWTGPNIAPPENISNIIAMDLLNSGKFNPLDISKLPQQPTAVSEVIPATWSKLGVNAIIIGQVQLSSDDSYVISYQLIDTTINPGDILLQNQFKFPLKWLRWAGHTISDENFEKLTGIKGSFRTRIAYTLQNNSHKYPYQLYVSDYDGFNQMLVYSSSQPIMSPAWSHDGKKIAYVVFEDGKSRLVIKSLDTGIISTVSDFNNHNGAPAFSPDGKKLAFVLSKTGKMHLYVMELFSGKIRQITDNNSNNTEPSWFPNSETLAYTSDQSGAPQIYKININNNKNSNQRLSWEVSQNQNACVSSDGKFLVMININNNAQHVMKLNLVTGESQILTDTLLDKTPYISPNGVMIVYSSIQEMNSVLQLISIDGCLKKTITIINKQAKNPTWSPYL